MCSVHIGDIEVAGRSLAAPMTGVSDLPFRRAAARAGATYVATEMVACNEFARGRPDVVRRAAVGEGLPVMVVQLVGREPQWMAKGAKPGDRGRRRYHRPEFRLPRQGSDRRPVRLGPDARPGPGRKPDPRRRRGHRPAGDGQDAPGLGRGLDERRRTGRPGRGGRGQGHHRARAHAQPILQGSRRLDRRRRRQGRGEHPGDRQRRHCRGR